MTLRAGLWFVDSNVLLSNLDSANTVKQRSAHLWLDKLWEHGCGCLSWQVLNEFYANGTGKIGAPEAVVRTKGGRNLCRMGAG